MSPLSLAAVAISAGAHAADKLTVLLDWYVNPTTRRSSSRRRAATSPATISTWNSLPPPGDAAAPPRLVAAGQADVAITYQPDLMLQIKEGLPVVRFGTLIETPLNCLIVLKDGPIKTLADLKGKTVGYSVTELPGRLLVGDPDDGRAVGRRRRRRSTSTSTWCRRCLPARSTRSWTATATSS